MKAFKALIAVVISLCVIFAFASCSSKEYKDTVVTVTNDSGEAVTDDKGNAVTEVVTTTGESASKDAAASSKASDTSSSKKDNATEKSTKSSTKKAEKTTKKSNKTTTTKKNTTEQSTSAPENRKVTINILLPSNSNKKDKIIISINGKEVKTADIKLDGSVYAFSSAEKYKGKINIEVSIENYKKSGKAVIAAGEYLCTVDLSGIEGVVGEND